MDINSNLLLLESLSVRIHGGACTYAFCRLPPNESPLNSLVDHLKRFGEYQERLPLQLIPLEENWRPVVESLVLDWVFGEQASADPGAVAQNVALVHELNRALFEIVGDAASFEVGGAGSMVPSTIWNAIVFSNGEVSWILEFGWDD